MKKNDQKSILEKFPQYGFQPTSLCNKRPAGRKWLCGFLIPIELFATTYTIDGIVYAISWELDMLFLWIYGFIIGITIVVLTIRWLVRTPRIASIADYIQSKKGITIFVRDSKWGILNNRNHKVLVPAVYDKLSWLQMKKTLRAYKDGETYVIDINNNRLG